VRTAGKPIMRILSAAEETINFTYGSLLSASRHVNFKWG
jgi:hypothetical protein